MSEKQNEEAEKVEQSKNQEQKLPSVLDGRDKKILEFDTNKDRKKLKKETRKLRKEIEFQRETLDNAIQGDRQRLRNTLSDNRNLLLAYQNMHPTKVLEVLYQANFNKRKLLDRVKYGLKQKTSKLIDIKLEYAALEDRIKYESTYIFPDEDVAQIITAKVQDAVMKNETALDVQKAYNMILNLLQKDAIFFDAVLRALQIDGFNQGKCILKITEMGQLATEYVDDKNEEYDILETALKSSMVERERGINEIKDKIANLHNNVKYLIRRDSVIILDEEKRSKHTYSETELMSSVQNISFTLDRIKEITLVSKVEDIFSRFEGQEKQKTRLEELVAKNTKDRDTLLNKSKHAEEMYNNLSHHMVETTVWYKEEKSRIHDEMQALKFQTNDVTELIRTRGNLFLRVRRSLQQLAVLLRNVRVGQAPGSALKKEAVKKEAAKKEATKKKQPEVEFAADAIIMPEKVIVDAKELLTLITKKVQMLVKESNGLTQTTEAENAFENFVTNMIETSNVIDVTVKEESLIVDMMLEDPQVPSRNEIKHRSAVICELNAKTEYDV